MGGGVLTCSVRVMRLLLPATDPSASFAPRTSPRVRLGTDHPDRPAGTLHLDEGLICARLHIHMTTADAEAYGVADGDEVEIRIDGGPRDLIFGDVLIRVKDSYQLEMHIDTDEANAAELSRGASGGLVYTSPAGDATAGLQIKRPHLPRGA